MQSLLVLAVVSGFICFLFSLKKFHNASSDEFRNERKNLSNVKFNEDDQEYIECNHWPHLLILGTQKAGTTSLFRALMDHPNSCYAQKGENNPDTFQKEVHFFDKPKRYNQKAEFYCSRFETCERKGLDAVTDQKLIDEEMLHIDSTPGYFDFEVAHRMEKTFPPSARKNMKLIVVLREPVGRLLSWYNHMRFVLHDKREDRFNTYYTILRTLFKNINPDDGVTFNSGLRLRTTSIPQGNHLDEFLSFEEFTLTDEVSLRRGKYIDILREYLNVFDLENILVLNFDNMLKFPRKTLAVVSEFVGVDYVWNSTYTFEKANEHVFDDKMTLEKIDSKFLKELVDFYHPYNKELYSFLRKNRDKFWHGQPSFGSFRKIVVNEKEPQSVNEKDLLFLQQKKPQSMNGKKPQSVHEEDHPLVSFAV